jgi:hypothetical protein
MEGDVAGHKKCRNIGDSRSNDWPMELKDGAFARAAAGCNSTRSLMRNSGTLKND